MCFLDSDSAGEEKTGFGLGQGMLDRSRIMLCALMFGILAFNPFHFLFASQLQGAADASTHFGRTLQGMEDPTQGGKFEKVTVDNFLRESVCVCEFLRGYLFMRVCSCVRVQGLFL